MYFTTYKSSLTTTTTTTIIIIIIVWTATNPKHPLFYYLQFLCCWLTFLEPIEIRPSPLWHCYSNIFYRQGIISDTGPAASKHRRTSHLSVFYSGNELLNRPWTAMCGGSLICCHSSLPSQQSHMPSFTRPDVNQRGLSDCWNVQ